MAFTSNITGATNRSSIFRGDVGFISGTWSSTAETEGTILTGGSTILAHGVTIGSAMIDGRTLAVGSSIIFTAKNQTGGGDALNGAIRVSEIGSSGNGIRGDWWAVARI